MTDALFKASHNAADQSDALRGRSRASAGVCGAIPVRGERSHGMIHFVIAIWPCCGLGKEKGLQDCLALVDLDGGGMHNLTMHYYNCLAPNSHRPDGCQYARAVSACLR